VIVALLEETAVRVGNEEYARSNGSYGLTTLRTRHVRARARSLTFVFRGKSGRRHEVAVSDPRLARIVRRCQDLPGQLLFQYEGDDGICPVTSSDVNDFLRGASGLELFADGTLPEAWRAGPNRPAHRLSVDERRLLAVLDHHAP
jgi:DNA topoisomerase-1